MPVSNSLLTFPRLHPGQLGLDLVLDLDKLLVFRSHKNSAFCLIRFAYNFPFWMNGLNASEFPSQVVHPTSVYNQNQL